MEEYKKLIQIKLNSEKIQSQKLIKLHIQMD